MAFRKIDLQSLETDIANLEDPLVLLNYGATGSNTRDLGFIFDRGSDTNVGLIWDESQDHFALINTSESGATVGNIIVSNYANIKANSFIGNLTGDITGDITGNVTGNLTGNVTGDITGNLTGNSSGIHTGAVTGNVTGNVAGNINGTVGAVTPAAGIFTSVNTTGNAVIGGNLTVNGTTTTVNSTVTTIVDPIITLGQGASDDNKDRGIEFSYSNSGSKVGFFGFDDSTSKFIFIPDGSVTNEVASGTPGTAVFGNVEFPDNGKAIFGAGSDLQIYHDGSHSYISDTGTGHLKILAASLLVQNISGNNRIFADQAGPVNLYHGTDGSPKLVTSATGVTVTGTVTASGVNIANSLSIGGTDYKQTFTHNENSSPYIATSSDATSNTSSTHAITAATLGFDLSNAISYTIFINRLHLRSSEVSVNTSNGTLTFSAGILDASDEIDVVWIT